MIVRELITRLGFKVDNSKIDQFDRKINKTKKSVQGLVREMRNLGQAVQGAGLKMTAFVTLPIVGLGLAALKSSSEIEQMNVAFETMLGSAEKSDKFLKDLFAFVAQTPFELRDAGQSAKLLLAMGIEAEKIIPTMTALGNVASGASVPMERLARNFGQVRTTGRLMGRELMDFNVAGVPLAKELAKNLNVSEKAIKNMVTRGEIGFKDVEKAFITMTSKGGMFFNLMQKQSKTLGGVFSNLKDAIFLTLGEFGDMIEETFNLKENIKKLTDFIDKLKFQFEKLSPQMRKIIVISLAIVAAMGPILLIIGSVIVAATGLILVFSALSGVIAPVLLGIAAMVLLFGAFVLIVEDFITFMRGGNSVFGLMFGDFSAFKKGVMSGIEFLKGFFSNFWNGLIKGNEEAFEALLDDIDKIFQKIGQFISEKAPIILKLITEAFLKAFDVIAEILPRIVEVLLNVAANLIKLFFTKTIPFLFTEFIPAMVRLLTGMLKAQLKASLGTLGAVGSFLGRQLGFGSGEAQTDDRPPPNLHRPITNLPALGQSSTSTFNFQLAPGTTGQQFNEFQKMIQDELGSAANDLITSAPRVE